MNIVRKIIRKEFYMNIDMETKVESCNYNDIEQIKILNETTKELVATILCL